LDTTTTTAIQHLEEESELKPLGTIRIECPYPVLSFALKEILKGEAHDLYEGRKPHGAQDPACVILCPNGKDIAPEVRRLRTFMPADTAIMVFSVEMNPRVAQSALRAGASGLIHAGMRPEQIVRALRLACAGKIVVSGSTVSRGLVESLVAEKNLPDLGTLTPRQREILELVCEGLSNAQIAERLFLTESTIKQHLYAAYKLLNVRNRIQAAKILQET
jgi:DNA-binding NarL/FixJ family response regulator